MIKNLEVKIQDLYTILNNQISKLDKLTNSIDYCNYQGEELEIKEEIDNELYTFSENFKKLYFVVLEFLERSNSNQILQIFKTSYNCLFDDNYKVVEYKYFDFYEDYIHFSPKLKDLKLLLEPYDILSKNDIVSINYLENILNSSGYLVENLLQFSSSETSVSNCVKTVLKSVFGDFKNLSEPFVKTAKCYRPDIMIPSLKICIEYKYAKDESRLINTIGEIYEDVHGYSNHSEYNNFYAVFYTQNFNFPKHRFDEIVKEKKFPTNWNFILINGK